MLGADHTPAPACLDADGRYGGEIEFYCQGPGKAVAIRAFAERYGTT